MELKDKLQLKVYSGVSTIGGTIVSLIYKNERVIFDFGTEYNPSKEVLEKLVHINDDNALEIYLEAGMLPNIEGVYEKNEMRTTVFISHLHLDHFGGIGLIDPGIDVYMSEKTLSLYNSLVKVGERVYGHRNEFKSFEGTMTLGEFKVTILPIDHDCYGSSGFIFEVAGKKIVFSGDIRFHGNTDSTLDFIDEAKGADILLVEGVSNSFKDDDYEIKASLELKGSSEKDVPVELAKVLETGKVVAFDYYRTNVDRGEAILRTAEQAGREVILTEMQASILKDVIGYESRTIEELEDFNDTSLLINLDYKQFDKYVDKLPAGSLYVHLNSEPLGDFDSRWEDFIQQLEVRDIELVQIHCSGHGESEHVQYFIDNINPKLLMPVHSFKPYMAIAPNKRIIPEVGVTYVVEDILK